MGNKITKFEEFHLFFKMHKPLSINKMKLRICIIAILFQSIINQSYSQNFWEHVYFPDSSSVFAICLNHHDIYIASGAGVYNSIDNGSNWNMLGLSHRIIHSVAVNDNGDIYAGTSQDPELSQGLYRSVDNGITWQEVLHDIGVYGNVVKILPLGDKIFASLWMGGARLIRTTDNCQTWNLVFATENTSEYISDILMMEDDEIYASLSAFMGNMGGVYKSSDWGDTWEYSGLFNCQVRCLAKNNSGDIFAGSWGDLGTQGSSGLYVLRHGQTYWDLLIGMQIDDVVVNSDEEIFISTPAPSAALKRSVDNGQIFEVITTGLPANTGMGAMEINEEGVIYLTSGFLSSYLAKSINTSVTIPEAAYSSNTGAYTVYPNPMTDKLNIKSNCHENSFDTIGIKVYNPRGEIVFSKEISLGYNTREISLNNIISSVYILEISEKKSKYYFKILKN
ncbi:MAG: T9SS type A sorting domain-containing protein [Bacteroidetes bacterium]|nr:T9SS type A sorting domain-containing protein [Bacteroidota bacterium]